jgi:hypothetical protein
VGKIFVAILLVGLGGCAGQPSSLLPYELDVPMQVLSVPGAPPAIDGRGRYRQLFCAELATDPEFSQESCEDFLHKLVDEPQGTGLEPAVVTDLALKVVVVPGLFSDCVESIATPFETSGDALASIGVEKEYLPISGRSGADANARLIANYISALELAPGQRLVLVGHSKGVVDILQFLVSFPELAQRVSAVLSVTGAINGSPRADDAYEDYREWLAEVDLLTCDAGDGLAMEHLTRRYRMTWLANNTLPDHIRYYSLTAFVNQDGVGLNSMRGYRALARIDPRNDGQLLFYDQVIPGSTILATMNTNHWAASIPMRETHPFLANTIVTNNRFPREVMLKAALRFIDGDLVERVPASMDTRLR